jgi:parallel beta-helix repeat protein
MKSILTLIGSIAICCSASAIPGKSKNPAAVARVASGELTTANASWWGFDSDDATAALQGAINSTAKTVIVPFMGEPWTVLPIKLRSNLELIFEPGVVILAKPGEFKERWDCLFSAIDVEDIKIRGNNTILRMRKEDYRNPPYPPNEEWKHVLQGEGCQRVLVEGLRMESSGGDGIYFGSGSARGSEDITIRNCVSHNNHRQGISLTDVKNLLVENCVFSGTEGTGPSAGVDYEPDRPTQKLVNCVFRNCLFENNAGHGMFVRPHDFRTEDSEPISIRFENCTARMSQPNMGGDSGMCVRVPGDEGPKGTIEFINCVSENTGQAGANIYGMSVGHLKIRFVNCNWINSQGTAVVLNMHKPSENGTGSIEFVDCSVYEKKTTPTVQVVTREGKDYGDDIGGTITVYDENGASLASEPHGVTVNLNVIDARNAETIGNSGPADVTGRTIKLTADRRAGDIAGYDDESTFGELWATHEFISDLPKAWRFRLDFNDQGQKQDWGGLIHDKTQWQAIRIGEWWEPQGHHYDGIGWYRVAFDVPDVDADGLALSFGAIDESAWVHLNGKLIGEHDIGDGGWDQRFEIPLGDHVKVDATNIVTVRVRDRGNFGGIWKSVKLVRKK